MAQYGQYAGGGGTGGGGGSFLEKELPHLIILVILVVVLLVVLTKFQWVHCSQIPGNWCEIYCTQIIRSHSRVALISGNEGIGVPRELQNEIKRVRPYTYLEPFPESSLSAGLLKNYDLIVLERMQRITFKQSQAIRDYVNRGGSVIWIGDAASKYYVDQIDAAEEVRRIMDELEKKGVFEQLLAGKGVITKSVGLIKASDIPENSTLEDVKKIVEEKYAVDSVDNLVNKTKGFGPLSDIIGAKYVETKTVNKTLELQIITYDHLITKGLLGRFDFNPGQYVVVSENPARVTKLASIKDGENEYPAILETRYSGKVIYVAYPLEKTNSSTLVNNLFDYLITC